MRGIRKIASPVGAAKIGSIVSEFKQAPKKIVWMSEENRDAIMATIKKLSHSGSQLMADSCTVLYKGTLREGITIESIVVPVDCDIRRFREDFRNALKKLELIDSPERVKLVG